MASRLAWAAWASRACSACRASRAFRASARRCSLPSSGGAAAREDRPPAGLSGDCPGARIDAAGSTGLAAAGLAAARTGDWPGAIVVSAGSAGRATAAGGCAPNRSRGGGGSG